MRTLRTLLIGALAAAVAATALGAGTASAAQGDLENGRLANCFFHYGAVGVNDYNVAYPDAGATYWAAFIRRPAGSTLKIKGTFPHARYMSLLSYDSAGQFVDGVADYQIAPDAGSANPFLSGADRTTADGSRQYTVNVKDARATVDGTAAGADLFTQTPKNNEAVRNDLYARPRTPLVESANFATPAAPPVTQLELIVLRVYVPDQGTDLNGNVPMPTPDLTLADGTQLTGQAACDAMDSESTQYKAVNHTAAARLPDPTSLLINEQAYDALRYPDQLAAPCNAFASVGCPPVDPLTVPAPAPSQPAGTPLVARPQAPGSVPATFPAQNPAVWRAQYTRRYFLQTWAGDDAPGAETAPVRSGGGGFFPNIHNNYVRALINRKFGKVIVLRGKLPSSPKTFDGGATMGNWANGGYQDRYTSYCMNESIRSTRVSDCAYDEDVPVDDQGRYTIVVSRTEDRPANATKACGRAWIQWSPYGDGASYKGDALTDDDGGMVQMRTMVPDPSFAQAVQNTHTPGDEKAVMGDYLPTLTYHAQSDVENAGCGFSGFDGIRQDGSTKWIKGLPLPVSFRLRNASGDPVKNAVVTLDVAPVNAGQVGTYAPATPVLGTGNLFKHVILGEYLYGLRTTAMAKGVWNLRATFKDGSQKNVNITLK